MLIFRLREGSEDAGIRDSRKCSFAGKNVSCFGTCKPIRLKCLQVKCQNSWGIFDWKEYSLANLAFSASEGLPEFPRLRETRLFKDHVRFCALRLNWILLTALQLKSHEAVRRTGLGYFPLIMQFWIKKLSCKGSIELGQVNANWSCKCFQLNFSQMFFQECMHYKSPHYYWCK